MSVELVPWDLDCGDCGYPLWYGQTCPRCGWDEDDGYDDDRDDDDDDGWYEGASD